MTRTPRRPRRRRPRTKEHAYALLFCRETYSLIRYWLARLGVPSRDRPDVAQEVLAAAWTSWHTYDPARAHPERWLHGIAVHIAARYHDRAYRRREELRPAEAIDAPNPAPLAVDSMIAEQDRQGLRALVQSVDPDLRSVLVGHYIDGIPMTDIAEQHGLPLSTAYKRRARALAALEAALWEVERVP